MHALKVTTTKGEYGLGFKAYAEATGRKSSTVALEERAATVFSKDSSQLETSELLARSTHLAEIHVAPDWLWGALVILPAGATGAGRGAGARARSPAPPGRAC
jgi:hypothetical protein